MDHNSDADSPIDSLIRQPSSHLSECSINSNSTLVGSPSSPPLLRHGYRRANSAVEEDSSHHGLGISGLSEQGGMAVARKPIASKSSPGSADLLLSPMSAYRTGEDRSDEEREETLHGGSNFSSHQPFTPNSDCEPLQKSFAPAEAEFECRMRRPPQKGRSSWLAISILGLSIYSTVFSAAWFLIAIIKPRYGSYISTTKGRLPITTASILCAAFAKSIEVSFVTVFVTFVGQALSKQARFQPKGITIAEMSMRLWVMQPGTMISHWESVWYAAATRLGVFSLLVAFMAMIYTTASDALVTPVLNFGATEHRILYGKVSTSFANTDYVVDHCNTPIQQAADADKGRTCIQIEHSGQAYHNYMQYLTSWVDNISSKNLSDSLTQRPDPVGMVCNYFQNSINALGRKILLACQSSSFTSVHAFKTRADLGVLLSSTIIRL